MCVCVHGAVARSVAQQRQHVRTCTTLHTQGTFTSGPPVVRVRCGLCRPDCVSVRFPSCLVVHCLPLAGWFSAATFGAAQRTTWRVYSPRTSPSRRRRSPRSRSTWFECLWLGDIGAGRSGCGFLSLSACTSLRISRTVSSWFRSTSVSAFPIADLFGAGKTLPKFPLEVLGACRRRHTKLTTSTFQ